MDSSRAKRVRAHLDLSYAAAFSRIGNLELAKRATHRAFVEAFRRDLRPGAPPEFADLLAVVLSEQSSMPSVQLGNAIPHRPVPEQFLEESHVRPASPASLAVDPPGDGLLRTAETRAHRAVCEALAALSRVDRAMSVLVFVQEAGEERAALLLALARREAEESVQRILRRVERMAQRQGRDVQAMLSCSSHSGLGDPALQAAGQALVNRLRHYRLGEAFVQEVLEASPTRIVLE